MALNQQRKKPQFLAEIALAFLVFFGFAPVASAGIIDDIFALPGQLAAGAQIVTREVAPAFFNPASLAAVFNDIKCFFGIDCQKPPASTPAEAPNPKNQIPNNI